MEYTYSFEFARSEHVRACYAIHRHAMRGRWTKRLTRVGLFLFAVFVVINMAADIGRGQFPAMIPALIVLMALPFAPVLNGYLAARQWEKVNPIGHRTVTVGFDRDRFHTASYVGSVDLRWPAVKQIVETPTFLLVYVADRVAYYVPKRTIPTEDLTAIRQLLRSLIDSKHVHVPLDTPSAV